MKAVVVAERSSSDRVLAVRKDKNCGIMKSTGIDFRGEKFSVSDEMKECFLKLKDMVPDVPLNEDGNIDGTLLMQYVIDYILDLELQLDGQSPALNPFSLTPSFATSHPFKISTTTSPSFPHMTSVREPLVEKSIDNLATSQVSSCCLSYSEESSLLDCDVRPPSK